MIFRSIALSVGVAGLALMLLIPASTLGQSNEIDSNRSAALAELGLEEDDNSGILIASGSVMIVLGLGVVAGSIWYYRRPAPEQAVVEAFSPVEDTQPDQIT